jgi:hypothetical protein
MKKLLFIFFVFLFFSGKGQNITVGDTLSVGIIYKNIKDTSVSNAHGGITTCDLDIDSDNAFDIRFSYTFNTGIFYSILKNVTAISNVEFAYSTNSNYADTLPDNFLINNTLNWKKTGIGLYSMYTAPPPPWGPGTTVTGGFSTANDYLGFRKITSSDTIYGWFLLDMSTTMIIKSFAYESHSVGIKELDFKNNKIILYPNPSREILNIYSWEREFDHTEVEITNQLGQTVLKQPFKKQINISFLNTGCYFIKLISEDRTILHSKFVKE